MISVLTHMVPEWFKSHSGFWLGLSPSLINTVLIVKAMVFPVVMYGCEIWTVKKAEHQRIDAFEL